ncbi:hypothetical protein OROGR_015477 [Orobanche gracilis]
MPILVQSQRACELSNACAMIFRAAIQYRSEHLWYPPPEGLTPWYSRSILWSGLWSFASFMLNLLRETSCIDDSVRFDFYSNLEVLSEVLLEVYSNAITAKIERKEDHKTLLEEYWKCRDTLLDSLYKQVKFFCSSKTTDDSAEENEELNKDTLMTLSSKLLSIAKRHEGYQTMWNICSDLNDSELLQCLMGKNVGRNIKASSILSSWELFHGRSASFLRSNTSLLEECWRNAANQDDWERLYQMSVTDGWSDERTFEILKETVLFQASSKCYGPGAESFDVKFDEVLLLVRENDRSSSVEEVLMQHQDFPDAGKLMVTAIVRGSVWVGSADDVGPTEMNSSGLIPCNENEGMEP